MTYSGDEFRIYVGNLNFIRKGTVRQDTITTLGFGNENRFLYIGTKKGLIYRYELPDLTEISALQKKKDEEAAKPTGEPFKASSGKPVTEICML